MKYLYIVLALVVVGGAYGGFVYYNKNSAQDAVTVPIGFHVMKDGTLMSNEQGATINMESSQIKATTTLNDSKKSTVTLDPNARVFGLKGVNYGYDVKEIIVKEGDTVTINFESTDGFHDVVINEFAVATKRVQPGVKTSATFVADKKGTFEYYCSVGSHRDKGMVGKLIVQ